MLIQQEEHLRQLKRDREAKNNRMLSAEFILMNLYCYVNIKNDQQFSLF